MSLKNVEARRAYDRGRNKRPDRVARANKWRLDNRERALKNQRDYAYRSAYGIDISEYEEMLKAQGGACYLCGGINPSTRLHVDHNHDTGEVRKLLCAHCNHGVAFVENSEWLRKARAYLTDAPQEIMH